MPIGRLLPLLPVAMVPWSLKLLLLPLRLPFLLRLLLPLRHPHPHPLWPAR
ncbi:hypothetical protein AX018_100555 [Paracidovorax anthurii]|uniref:Uncharacterized protein n=1 Tax=Paracidovorax anthurii TaxID=78229 RepID=A0A328ZRH1_9BURK|nr:hypothetical protein AX018_100555 [Paracidovorax anthurii]